jgi:myosin heavy subunit
MSNKRKGEETTDDSATVVFSPAGQSRSQQQRMAWLACQQRLTAARKYLSQSTTDLVLQKLQHHVERPEQFQQQANERLEEADEVYQKLQKQVETTTAACQQESQSLHQVQTELSELQEKKKAVQAQIQEGADTQHELQQEIARYRQEASTEMEGMQEVKVERQLKVPRLRHQLSLYAACTGVKWNFEKEKVLAGEVVRLFDRRSCSWHQSVLLSELTGHVFLLACNILYRTLHHRRKFGDFPSILLTILDLMLPINCGPSWKAMK